MSAPSDSRQAPRSVLFLCGRNAVRSPLAAAMARRAIGRNVYVRSAGVRPSDPDPFTAAVAAEIGLDLGDHQPHTIDELEDTGFDLVITLAPEAHHHALELARTQAFEVEYWPTPDPTPFEESREQRLLSYRTVRDQLAARIAERFGTGGDGGDAPR